MQLKQGLIQFLKWTEKYTKTDMLYFVRGSFWLMFGKIVSMLLSVATMSAFAIWVPKEIFGKFQYIDSTINILAIFMLPAMGAALVRSVAKGREGMLMLCAKTKAKWGSMGIFITIIIAIWYILHGNIELGYSFLVASFLFPLPRIFNLYSSVWDGKKQFDTKAKFLILINFLELITFAPVLFLTNNLIIIILAYFISRSLFRGISFIITLKKSKNKETDRETVSFGKKLTLINALEKLAQYVDKIIIWQFLGAVPVAIYSFAEIPIKKTQDLTPLTSLALPKLSQKNLKQYKKGLLNKFFKFFLLTIPVTLIFVLAIPLIYKFIFPNYSDAIPYARVLSLSLILLPFSLLDISLTAEMKIKELYMVKLAGPFIKIILFLALIPLYGIWGVVISFLISKFIQSTILFYIFKKI